MLTQRSQRSLRASLHHTSSRLSSFRPPLPVLILARFQSASSAPAKAHHHHHGGKNLEPGPTINAPISTLPAPLELPQKTPGEATIPYLFKTGKAYVCMSPPGIMRGGGSKRKEEGGRANWLQLFFYFLVGFLQDRHQECLSQLCRLEADTRQD